MISLGIDIHSLTNNGQTLLHYCCGIGNIKIAKYLIKLGVDKDIRAFDGKSLLHVYCARIGCLKRLKYILSLGFDIEEASEDCRTAFLYAAYDGYESVMEYLAKRGANIYARSKDGKTALHWSCQCSLGFDDAKYLVSIGIDVNAQDDKGKTYLHYVIPNYGIEDDGYCNVGKHVMEHLIANGADMSIKDNDGNTPLEAKRCSWWDNDEEDESNDK